MFRQALVKVDRAWKKADRRRNPLIQDAFSLKGKNALVTGSRTGLGAAIAIGLAQAGANVVVHGRSAAGMDPICATIRQAGGKAVTAVGDVSQPGVCENLIELTVREF